MAGLSHSRRTKRRVQWREHFWHFWIVTAGLSFVVAGTQFGWVGVVIGLIVGSTIVTLFWAEFREQPKKRQRPTRKEQRFNECTGGSSLKLIELDLPDHQI